MHNTPRETTVMILAAGEGKRMRPLTAHTPKPLLKVGKYSLIEHHLIRLSKFGFKNIVINIAYLSEQIKTALGDGSKYGLKISYSDESKSGALETAGGICKALPLIHSDLFLVINADIWTDYDFRQLLLPLTHPSRIVLVPNPAHNPEGDFIFENEQLKLKTNITPQQTGLSVTFSGIACYKKSLFAKLPQTHRALAPVLRAAIQSNDIEGQLHSGLWYDIGTPERLTELNQLT